MSHVIYLCRCQPHSILRINSLYQILIFLCPDFSRIIFIGESLIFIVSCRVNKKISSCTILCTLHTFGSSKSRIHRSFLFLMQIQGTRSPLHWANAFYWNHQGANIIYNIYHYLNYHQLVMEQISAEFSCKMSIH